MKRALAALLSLALCLALTACAKSDAPRDGDRPDAANTAQEDVNGIPVSVQINDTLHVEFVAGDRDVDELLALQSAFPQALSDALEKQGVTFDTIGVTFGTSDEATLEAIRSGAVDVGFVTAETAVAEYPDGVIAIEQGEDPDLASGVIVLGEKLSAAAWNPTAVLRAALPDLAPVLIRYTGEDQGGAYVPLTDAVRERLTALCEAARAEDVELS